MADQADVETALASLVANALYPNGTTAPSAIGSLCRIYRGFPAAPALDADLASGVLHVSVAAVAGRVKNVTRYPRSWVAVAPVPATLAVAVGNISATFSGKCAAGQLAGVAVAGGLFPYAVQASDTPATVASNLAAALRMAGWIVDYAGSTIIVPRAAGRGRGAGRSGKLTRHPALMDCLYLVQCGVPYRVAFALDDAERVAYVVIYGTLSGLSFDWKRLQWADKR